MSLVVKKEYATIRQIAFSGLIAENALRKMVKRGECPGYYEGTRFMVNVQMLEDALREKSKTEEVKC